MTLSSRPQRETSQKGERRWAFLRHPGDEARGPCSRLRAVEGVGGVKASAEGIGRNRRVVFTPDNPAPLPKGSLRWRKKMSWRVMAKPKTLKDRLFGAAVLKMSFRLRGDEKSPAFRYVYPGVLRDLELDDNAVEKYIEDNRAEVERVARGKPTGSA